MPSGLICDLTEVSLKLVEIAIYSHIGITHTVGYKTTTDHLQPACTVLKVS